MSNFNIGDSVEVLPAPEEAGFTWRMVSKRHGTVGAIDTSRPCSRTVGVLFQDGSVYWCEPAWLRRVVNQATGPRYKVGDLVDGDEFERGEVREVMTEPGYTVRWPSGYTQWIIESLLSPHKSAPVKCAPDGTRCAPGGTRCAWWRFNITDQGIDGYAYCPHFCGSCGGKLKEGT